MDDRDRLVELMGMMQRDLMPSLVRMHEEDDLQLLHAVVLQVVDRGQQPTIKQVARLIGRSVSRTSRIVDQLVRRDLLIRYEDEHDRRARRVRLSEQGQALVERIRAIRVQSMWDLVDHLDDEERATVMVAMELFAKAARRVRDERDPTE
jgi:DNA-binding MarR family transcriptional regulator